MALRGDLDTLSLAQLFQFLAQTGKEGTLSVTDGKSSKTVYFGDGGIRLMSLGERRAPRLGDLLIRSGRISPELLDTALKIQKDSGVKLGEVLQRMGVLTPVEIQAVVRHQIQEEIYDLFRWPCATFEFVEGCAPREFTEFRSRVTELSFDVNSFLLEALRVADEKIRDTDRHKHAAPEPLSRVRPPGLVPPVD